MRPAALMLFLGCTQLLAGCGASAPKPDPLQEARVIAETNAFCRHMSALPPVTRRSQQQIRAAQARLAAFSRTISKTAAYLPAGKDLNEAHVARRALFAEDRRRSQAELARPADFDLRVDRQQLRIYNDELALGLSCAGQVARAAHQTARQLARSAR